MKTPERLFVWVGAAALTVALTWPIAPGIGTVGRLDNGDARYSIWNVAWVAHALTTQPAALYDANIFYPHRQTIAFSEPNLLAGGMAAPAWWATGNPYFASNWVILWSFVLAAVTTYALVRRLSGSPFGAALAAISFAFCSFVFSHLAHVQLLLTFTLPLVLLAMHAFVDAPSVRRALGLGAALTISGFACGYYGVFAGFAAGLGVLWFGLAAGRWREWRYWTLALMAAGLAVVVIWPFFVPFAETDFARSVDDARLFSANWQAYLASPRSINRWMLGLLGDQTWREVLFPGWLPLVFGLFAVGLAFRRGNAAPPAPWRTLVGFYVLLGGVGAWASFGPAAGLYTTLQEIVPYFTLLRASARFGILTTLAFAILGGLGAAALAARLHGRTRRALVVASLAFAVVAARVGDLHFTEAGPLPDAHRRLIGMPRAPVAVFPYFSHPTERHRHTVYMLLSTHHWQPLVNGYSDHTPDEAFRDTPALAGFPSLEAWSALRDREVRYVVIHWNKYDAAERDRVRPLIQRQRAYLRPIVDDPIVALFEIVGWPVPVETWPTSESGPLSAEGGPPRR